MGICAETPPVLAVMVAVRLARLSAPALKVKVAVPSVPVVTVCVLTWPVLVPRLIVMLGTAAFVELSEVTVTVALLEPSDGTDVGVAERVSCATPDELEVGAPLPPQLLRETVSAMANAETETLLRKRMMVCTETPD